MVYNTIKLYLGDQGKQRFLRRLLDLANFTKHMYRELAAQHSPTSLII